MSLLGRIGKFAKSPQGQKLMKQAQQVAKDPKTKAKIAEVREKIPHKDDKTQEHTPAAPAPASTPTPKPANPPAGEGAPPPGASS